MDGQFIVKLCLAEVLRVFRVSQLSNINHSIAYLGCSTDYLQTYIHSKVPEGKRLIGVCHIKHLNEFDFDDVEAILKCCHFTNLYPMYE